MDSYPDTPPEAPALRILSVRYRNCRSDLYFYKNGVVKRYLTLKSQSLRSFFKRPYKSLWMDGFTTHEASFVMQEQMRDDLIAMMKPYQASLPKRPKNKAKKAEPPGKEVSHQKVSGQIVYLGTYPGRKRFQLDLLDRADNLEKSFIGGNLEKEISRTNVVEGDYITIQMTIALPSELNGVDKADDKELDQHIFYEIEKETAYVQQTHLTRPLRS